MKRLMPISRIRRSWCDLESFTKHILKVDIDVIQITFRIEQQIAYFQKRRGYQKKDLTIRNKQMFVNILFD